MKVKRIVLLLVIALAIGAGLTLSVGRSRRQEKLDMTAVNDILQSVAEQWETLSGENLPGMQYGMDYLILDRNKQLLIATRGGLNENIPAAIANRDTILDVTRNGELLGKLILYNDSAERWQQYQEQLQRRTLLLIFLMVVLCLLYLLLIDRMILRPFRKLKSFAKNVSEGRLELPLKMDRGNLFGAFTESFELMREELMKARENEKLANQSKKELVASLSHDIKTPVASIKAVSEVLYARTENETVRGQLDIIGSKADQINTLITNMFNATLEELQELKVTVTEQSSQILYELIRNADYHHRVTISVIEECLILADTLRLAQVVDNVISNSYKYAGTPIHVTSRIRGDYLELEFVDFGPGVAAEELPLLCNKFYRAGNAEGKSGTGLGLFISKYLMDKMSGEILCENTEEGFVVRISLLLV